MSGNTSRFGFNGKEKDPSIGDLTHYDYGARLYNPSIGRWLSVDPLTDRFPSLSSYVYCLNNPIKMIDPTGMAAIDFSNRGDPIKQLINALSSKASEGVVKYEEVKQQVSDFFNAGGELFDKAGQEVNDFINRILPEGMPDSDDFNNSGNTIGEGFELLTNSTSNSAGTAGSSHAEKGASQVIVVDDLLVPYGQDALDMALRGGPGPLKSMNEIRQSVENADRLAKNYSPTSDARNTEVNSDPRENDTIKYTPKPEPGDPFLITKQKK